MKVLQLSSSLRHDESERGIYPISHALIKAGHESIIIGSAPSDSKLVVRLVRDGAIYYRLPMPKKSWWALIHILKLRQIIEQHHPDIIHIHSRTPAWVLYWAMHSFPNDKRPKIISSLYGFYPVNSYSKALFHADLLISASKSIDKHFNKIFEKIKPEKIDKSTKLPDIICVPRGVDVRKYPYRHHSSVHWLHQTFAQFPELEHKKWLVFPTPIGPEYGQEWLIDILGNLQEKFPKIHAIIMDDDPIARIHQCVFYEDFVQRLHTLGLQDRVSFIGKNPPDMREWLSSANIVLSLANHPESIGMTALQAIHLGTPVIGWAKGAFADILGDLYPQGLVKEQTAIMLCKSVKFLLSNPIPPAMTHAYEIDDMVDNTIQVYQDLVKQSTE
ncbi:glycosyltransferase [Moraxella catarrhalis]|uniref:glycosyltransferase n=1 Tax=Moraxella catarrhalis TaxID=480 RepID=UPI0007E4D507|nr:glycosyltransferase [Moraxella catarrhalis]OAV28640.1 Glycosyltransferase [Moraxella catarrhalis]